MCERHGRYIKVTRRYIAEWRENCRAHQNRPACGSDLPARQKLAARSGRRPGSSSTASSNLAPDVLQTMLLELKQH